jgi:hypothetical protein
MKLDLLTNATLVDDAIRFVSGRPKSSNSSIFSKNKILEQQEAPELTPQEKEYVQEVKEEEETGEITTNHVF